MISNMAKPEEVVVVENEAGEVVRETMVDTDAVSLYKTMRATLGEYRYTPVPRELLVCFVEDFSCFVVYLARHDHSAFCSRPCSH